VILSSELAFEDFLRRVSKQKLRVQLEAFPHRLAPEVVYQADSDRLEAGLRSGTRLGLRLAFERCEGLSRSERRRAA
jgi:hypothetical protein